MCIIGNPNLWLIALLMIHRTTAEINLSPYASWYQNAITVGGQANGTNGSSISRLSQPFGISITSNDVLYISDTNNHRVVVVHLDSTTNISIIGSGPGSGLNQFNFPYDVFVTHTSLYVIDFGNQRVQKTSLNGSNPSTVPGLSGLNWPYYIYVDNDNNIYLSDTQNHRVLLFHSNSTNGTMVAGTGVVGANNNQLNQPYGLFVNNVGTMYIADCWNYRIMKWSSGASFGIIAAGDGTDGVGSTQLSFPTQVIVDRNEYMYISESGNSRITRWAPNSTFGVCIAACTRTTGSGSTQLNSPHSLAFDSHGSLYVSDRNNHRIQKFQIIRYQSPSYNQPKLSVCGTWNENAITFANISTVGPLPISVFVNTNNTVYVTATNLSQILEWTEGSNTPTRNISNGLNSPYGLFVTTNGDIYVDNGAVNHRVDKWAWNATSSIAVMNVTNICFSLFMDINDTLYCSNGFEHKVVKVLLNSNSNDVIIAAGNGTQGSESHLLYHPNGIFVDMKFNLYIADCSNNRVQLFRPGQLNATTVAGSGVSGSITLNNPSAVVLDADEYLFITDFNNHRIIRSGPSGFQCLFGCTGGWGSASNQLYRPYSLSFDSYGNLFVVDPGNNRIQKFLLSTNSCVPSYNQLKFSPCATWNQDAVTIANNSLVGSTPHDVFVDINNTIYVADLSNNRVQVWLEGSVTPTKTISGGLSSPLGIFVTLNGDLYVDNSISNHRVDKWTLNATTSVIATYVSGSCFGLFIDINDNLYCSMDTPHQVVKNSLHNDANTSSIAAGNGTAGSTSNMLNNPRGIFVDINLNLYVADCSNNRIQLFQSGQLNATTVAINGSNGTFTLNCPAEVVLDIDGYLFITDGFNNRILGSGPTGFRCIVGCTGTGGSASNQLDRPHSLSFDSYGNLFVIEYGNNRLQKFFLSSNSCDATTTNRINTTIAQTTTRLQQEQTSTVTTTIPITSTSTNFIGNQSCFPPVITLIPSTSSLSSPLQFRRNQDFYISSNIQLNCNDSLSTITQWTIYNCTSTICSFQIQIDQTIQTTFSELYIPARTLPYGIYQLKFTVAIATSLNIFSSSSAYVKITPSGITANLVPYGTSMITRGHQQDLTLDPGIYSVDPDSGTFNASDWKYEYYCRIYGLYSFPRISGSFLTIDDSRVDPNNPSCISNQSVNRTPWRYNGITVSPKSSITIVGGSFLSDQTYQFMVYMENRQNSSLQATGYLLVRVDDTHPEMIIVACVISIMCIPNLEFQLVNPTTQVALFSVCLGSCSSIKNITWNIYQGLNGSLSTVHWTLFNETNQYQNIWFFGTNTSNFTSTNKLFIDNSQIVLWRFEVVYSFTSAISSSALNFVINKPPQNGSCSINPPNGTTTTLFTISCLNWFDQDEIKDYSLYGYTIDRTNQVMIGFSAISEFGVRLPAGNDNTSVLNLIIHIRDTLDCITEYNITSVIVTADSSSILDLMNTFQSSTNSLTTNPVVRLLSGGNQNTVGQILTSISQQFNKNNTQSLENAVSNGIPASSISISLLGSRTSSGVSVPLNESALIEYNKQLNSYANVRDYLMTFTTNLLISTSNSIKLQSSSLVQLTQATNQLTKSSAMIASEICYQLAQSLYSMSTRIPYEDIQTAANQIAQCTSNLMSAINGPLQQRTTIIDLDDSRANTFPPDYDTDLESEWVNPNLFADGNDFSWETIRKGRNLYYQKQIADKISSQAKETISLLTSALNIHLNIGQNLTMNTSSVFMSLETISIESLSNKIIQQVGNAKIYLPSNLNLNINNNQTVSLRSIMQPLASADKSRSESNTNLSTSISLSILDQNGNEISIETTLEHPYKFIIPRDPNVIIPPMTLQNVTSLNTTPHHLLFNLHYINIVQSNNLTISVHIEMEPLNRSLGYLLIYKFNSSPQLNSSINQIDGWSLFCPSNLSNDNIYTYFIDNQLTIGHQSLIFGFRELNSTELNDLCSNQSMNRSVPISDKPFNFTSNYQLRIYTSGCYYLDKNNQWKSDGLVVGLLTNHNESECYSKHLTTFAGGFIVLPSPINWNYVFANADFNKNKTIYLTVICISILYLLLIIYSRYKDKKDIEKLGVTELPDNFKEDEYCYEIIVFTGHRKDSGTKSKVQFIICGHEDETKVRTFSDSNRKIFQRGGIDAFVMTVPKSLGSLNYIRLWHDNTGEGSSASWFLKYIIIRDLQTLEKSYFICQRWFAVEKDDGRIERVLPVAGDFQKQEFSYVLSKRAYHSISEGHLWFSIFSRPPSNKFTRVQRCTCCFVLLFTSMLLNILYYDQTQEIKTKNTKNAVGLSFGPLYITPEQIGIGVIVELLAFVPSLFLVQLFRRIRSRKSHQQISPLRQTLYNIKQKSIPKTIVECDKKKRSSLTFPWWCLFLAYGLSLLLAIVSIFFLIVRGIEFGDLKTQKWLTSLISGFISSILLIQPIKILSLAMFFACFIQKSDNDKEAAEYLDDDTNLDLGDDEQYLHSNKNKSPFSYRSQTHVNRLNEAELTYIRDQRIKELKMWSIIREVFIYLCFLSLLYSVSYSNVNSNGFYEVNHLRKFILNSRQINQDYTKISTINEYWNWLEKSFVVNIRAQEWYNGDTPRNLSGYINDKTNRLIGWITMRQLRVKSHQCQIQQNLSSECEDDYSWFNEEKRSFEPGWKITNQTTQIHNLTILRAFRYQNGDELDSYIYMGEHAKYNSGGYVYEYRGRLSDIRSNLSLLHKLEWINSKTRAVIIQFNLYNPNVELFSSTILLAEFLSTGGLYPQSRFHPFSFQIFTSLSQLICSILYMIFIIYMMIVQVQTFLKLRMKYFSQFWSYIDIGIIICSWTSVGIYVWIYSESKRIGDLFKETNGYVYINLQMAVYINDLLTSLIGFCCFFGTIKFVRLCRFNRRLLLFIETIRHAGKDLLSFLMMFSIVFFSFLCLFYLLFSSKLPTCSTLLSTAQMLFEMTLMKFDAYELIDASSFLGPFSFSLFIFLVVFVCLSMFITIINDSFRFVRDNVKHHQNEDEQIFTFMFYKFRRWIGKRSESQMMEQRDEMMRNKYHDPIEHFPDKIDQLLDALDRIYMDQQRSLSRKTPNIS